MRRQRWPARQHGRVQNGYVSSGTDGDARPPRAASNRLFSSQNVPARAREWTPVPHLSFPRNEGVPRFESGRRLSLFCRDFSMSATPMSRVRGAKRIHLVTGSLAAVPYDRPSGVRRGTRGSHTRAGRQRIWSDRAEDVRRARVSHWRQHGRGSKRPGWSIGSRRPSTVRHARGDDERSPHGNARAIDAGLATSRRGRPSYQTPARQMGRTWHDICSLANHEAIDGPGRPGTRRRPGHSDGS